MWFAFYKHLIPPGSGNAIASMVDFTNKFRLEYDAVNHEPTREVLHVDRTR